ncbi:glycosyltransferase [Streptomyces coeruleoprunus]|uniref:Glycosyltransferase n=1 Tax=Streptomyces coeruleoprunus TaxID=285563 RepID=A0ABV9X8M0_9ACTN
MTAPGSLPERAAQRLARAPETAAPTGAGTLLVSCVLVGDDPAATARAMRLFAEQDHEPRELVLVTRDTGGDAPFADDGPHVRVVTVPPDTSAAAARDVGCAAARGELLALWEPDSWYPPWRLRYQADALLRSGLDLSAAASAVVWDPAAGESWAGSAAPWSEPHRLFGATVCLTRRAWAAGPFAARGGFLADEAGCFVLDVPDGPFHVPRGAHLTVLVRPGTHPPEPGQPGFPRGTVERLLGGSAPDWGRLGAIVPSPAPPSGAPARPAAPGVALRGSALPLVTCVMPTFNRRRFIAQALRNLRGQDYPRLELVVVDDGSEPVEDLVADVAHVRYIRLGERATIGRKRDVACESARGEFVIQWDDDDWFGPERVSRQVRDLVRGTADLTGVGVNLMLDVRSMRLWSTREQEAADPRYASIEALAAGTLAYPLDWWRRVGGYPDASLGEDIGLVQRFADAGARIQALSNRGMYVYIRHGRNSWRFDFTPDDGPPGWNRVEGPGPLSAEDLAFYASFAPTGSPAHGR